MSDPGRGCCVSAVKEGAWAWAGWMLYCGIGCSLTLLSDLLSGLRTFCSNQGTHTRGKDLLVPGVLKPSLGFKGKGKKRAKQEVSPTQTLDS